MGLGKRHLYAKLVFSASGFVASQRRAASARSELARCAAAHLGRGL